MMAYRCSLCEIILDKIPSDAVQLSRLRNGYIVTTRFSDGTIHILHRTRPKSVAHAHARWHVDRGIKKLGCPHCYPEQTPAEPAPAVVEEVMPEVASKRGVESAVVIDLDQPEETTVMAAAFRKLQSGN